MKDSEVTRRVVGDFLRHVRSGQEPQRAAEFTAPTVRAHQVQSEDLATVERTLDDYAEHVREMTATWGAFDLTIEEFLVDGARAHVRLAQVGRHLKRPVRPGGSYARLPDRQHGSCRSSRLGG